MKVGFAVPCGGRRELVMDAAESKCLVESLARLILCQKAQLLGALGECGQDREVLSILE
jgi:hypothetical protein